jgi:thymidylate synthase
VTASGDRRTAQAQREYNKEIDVEKQQQQQMTKLPGRDPADLCGEAAYLALLSRILERGERRDDRTGTGTLSIFGAQLRFDLREGFPLLTTKKVAFGAIVRELLWFLRGSTNVRDDLTQYTQIWDAWADEDGELGPIYGHQWRRWGERYDPVRGRPPSIADSWRLSDDELERTTGDLDELYASLHGAKEPSSETLGVILRARAISRELEERRAADARGIDQISEAIATIKQNPDSRRIIVSAWNVADVPKMRLPPCHLLFQLYVQRGHLDCQLYQRSADMALGVPFNIASYALLMAMIAMECHLVPRYFIHTFGDAHIYSNHVDGIRLQLEREPFAPPRLALSDKPVLAQCFEDVAIVSYQHHAAIKFQVAV